MNELVSVIIPIYDAEQFIDRMIESVLSQSYSYFELILVDDGSRDSSLEICRKKEKKDKRIKIIEQKNSGVSVARNTGIEAAKGKYLLFVDSDDYIESNMIEMIISHSANEDDLTICGYYIHDMERNNAISLSASNKVYRELEIDELGTNFWHFYAEGLTNSPWNKLYVASIIKDNKIFFPSDIKMGEDLVFNLKYFSKIKKIKIINEYLYHYILYPNQTSRKVYLNIADDMLFFLKEIEKLLKTTDTDWKTHYYQIYKHLMVALSMPYRTNEMANHERLKYIIQTVKKFKTTFPASKIVPQSKYDKLMIHYIKHDNYKMIHTSLKIIEATKYRFKQLAKRM